MTRRRWSSTLNEVEAAVERIVIADSADGGVLTTAAPDGAPVASYTVTGTPGATAVAFAEFFRDSGGWKSGPQGVRFRAPEFGSRRSHRRTSARHGPAPQRDRVPAPDRPGPAGPQLLCLRAEGPWTFTVEEPG
ncbi:hypothetical protein ACF05T_34155 [Streptomyces lateritius]|uniref:DUF4440 domain-containing protein n=1 Tax=Streptomyces lateritius TaxID=67313 RepID=A0ABW6YMD5_9ACTN